MLEVNVDARALVANAKVNFKTSIRFVLSCEDNGIL